MSTLPPSPPLPNLHQHPPHRRDGFPQGLVRFEKDVEIVGCWITEDGGTVEANGAGIWNGETGRVVVKGFLTMRNNLAMVASVSSNTAPRTQDSGVGVGGRGRASRRVTRAFLPGVGRWSS